MKGSVVATGDEGRANLLLFLWPSSTFALSIGSSQAPSLPITHCIRDVDDYTICHHTSPHSYIDAHRLPTAETVLSCPWRVTRQASSARSMGLSQLLAAMSCHPQLVRDQQQPLHFLHHLPWPPPPSSSFYFHQPQPMLTST